MFLELLKEYWQFYLINITFIIAVPSIVIGIVYFIHRTKNYKRALVVTNKVREKLAEVLGEEEAEAILAVWSDGLASIEDNKLSVGEIADVYVGFAEKSLGRLITLTPRKKATLKQVAAELILSPASKEAISKRLAKDLKDKI